MLNNRSVFLAIESVTGFLSGGGRSQSVVKVLTGNRATEKSTQTEELRKELIAESQELNTKVEQEEKEIDTVYTLFFTRTNKF